MFFNRTYTTSLKQIKKLLTDYSIDKIRFNYDIRFYFVFSDYKKLNSKDFKKLIWLGTCHSDGYLREKYLKLLLKNFESSDINRILLRLLDWVPKISKIADDWLLNNYKNISLTDYLINIYALKKTSNNKNSSSLQSISKVNNFIWNSIKIDIHTKLKGFDSNTRKYVYDIAQFENIKSIYHLYKYDKDPSIRVLSFNDKFNECYINDVEYFKKDKSMKIRRFILYNIFIKNLVLYKKDILDMLTDSSFSIRCAAQYYAKNNYNIDPYTFYKQLNHDHKYYLRYISTFPNINDLEIYISGLNSNNQYDILASLNALKRLNQIKIIKSHISKFIKLNKKRIKKFLMNFIIENMTTDEVLELRMISIKSNFTMEYLQILFTKSYFLCIYESLVILNELNDIDSNLISYLNKYVFHKTDIYTKCDPKLKSKILRILDIISNNIISPFWKNEIKFRL